jgi:hypothetical protein
VMRVDDWEPVTAGRRGGGDVGGVLVVAKVGRFHGRRCRGTLRCSWKREVDGGELAGVRWMSTRIVYMGIYSAMSRGA